jgi:hypothetical protein
MNVHARLSDGEIVAHGTATVAPSDGCAVFTFPDGLQVTPDRDLHKIDIEYGGFVNKTPEETAASRLPTLSEIQMAIRDELAATDQFTMVADRPVPLRAAWVTYRQALRDLSKIPTTAAQLAAWPAHPLGHDIIKPLRDGTHSRFR